MARTAKKVAKIRSAKRRVSQVFRTVSLVNKVYPFRRVVQQVSTNVNDGLLFNAMSFALGALPSYTEFTSLFDQYRISNVKCKFIFDKNESTAGATAGNIMPELHTVLDYDDATTPASESDLFQYQTHKVNRLDKVITRSFKPRIAMAAYGGAFTQFANMPGGTWIDSGSPNVLYYGLKWCTDGSMAGGSGSNNIGQMRVYVYYNIECRQVR